MTPEVKVLLKDAVKRSAYDPAYFLRFFLPHWFPSPIPPVHLGLLAIATNKVRFLNEYPAAHEFLLRYFRWEPDVRDTTALSSPVFILGDDGRMKLSGAGEHLNQVIPRGFSKTTLCKGMLLYDLLTDHNMFAVYISASAGHAEAQVNDCKMELEGNSQLRAAYGNQVATRADSEKWTSEEIHLKNGAILVARGRGAQVRGLTHQGRRPNKIVLDDVEDEDSINTQDLREKTKRWFYSAVVPAGQIMEGSVGEEWAQEPLQIINLGTLLGPECLVRSLTSDPDFRTIRFGAKVDEGVMLWPYKLSEEKYEQMRARWRMTGELAAFTREYDSAIRVSEDALFPSTFIYEPVTRAELATVAIACDPAISEKKRADHSAIVVAGRRQRDGALFLLEEWGGVGKTPRDIIDKMFQLQLKWQADRNGIEAVQYQAALIFLMKEEMAKRRLFFHIEPIKQGPDDKKVTRIQGLLSPRYAAGFLRHLVPLKGVEGNLADWPNGKKDYADAAAMALTLMGETSGLAMEGALEPLPPMSVLPSMPEVLHSAGNYFIRGSQSQLRARNRYPIAEVEHRGN